MRIQTAGPHIFVASYIYELPFWRDGDEWYKRVLGSWCVSGVTTAQRGLPLNIIVNGDQAGSAGAAISGRTPFGDPALLNSDRTWIRWLDRAGEQAGRTRRLGARSAVSRGPNAWFAAGSAS